MIVVALKMLAGDRLKYFGLILGVAFAALLITQQASILVGLSWQTGAAIRDMSHADLWIMDDQVRFSQDSLPIQDTILYRARGVEGVEWAVPMYQGFLRARLSDGTRMLCIVIGIDDATLIGGPPSMVQGHMGDLRRDRAVIIDADAVDTKMTRRRSDKQGMRVGDRFSINDTEVEVVGTYRGSKSFFWEPVIYTTYTRALTLAPPERRLMNYVQVKCKDGADIAAIARRLQETTGLAVRTNDEFQKVTSDYILKETGILINFGLAVGLGFVVGALISAQMMYNFTLDNLRFYGALKAMGAGNARLIGMVLVQVVTIAVLGYGLGVGAGSVLGKMVGDAGLAFRMPWQIPVFAAVAILGCCLLAGLVSIQRVLRLEPGIVFRG